MLNGHVCVKFAKCPCVCVHVQGTLASLHALLRSACTYNYIVLERIALTCTLVAPSHERTLFGDKSRFGSKKKHMFTLLLKRDIVLLD